MSEPMCVVMVGLPASGKSTHARKIKDAYTFVYSTDAYIDREVEKGEYASYNEAFEHLIDEANKAMNAELDKMISWKNDVVWDQTNLGAGKRRKIINRMKQEGYQIRGVCFMPPADALQREEWNRRLNNRPGKNIPKDVLTKMESGYTIPDISEGFDMITFYDFYGNLLGIDYGE